MSDPNASAVKSLSSFGRKGAAVVPSDSTDFAVFAKAIVVTAAGNLVIVPADNADNETITFTGVSVGFIPPYQVRRVLATGTTASAATVLE
jgi:hypothetical protein